MVLMTLYESNWNCHPHERERPALANTKFAIGLKNPTKTAKPTAYNGSCPSALRRLDSLGQRAAPHISRQRGCDTQYVDQTLFPRFRSPRRRPFLVQSPRRSGGSAIFSATRLRQALTTSYASSTTPGQSRSPSPPATPPLKTLFEDHDAYKSPQWFLPARSAT